MATAKIGLDGGVWSRPADGDRKDRFQIAVEIDQEALVRHLFSRAVRSKKGVATALNGAVRVTALKLAQ